MSIHYFCRHCGCKVGAIDQTTFDSKQLGFDHLTAQERKEFIHYHANGDMSVKIICEDCHEALDRNPDYHQFETFIQ
jgi:hypothetical protein